MIVVRPLAEPTRERFSVFDVQCRRMNAQTPTLTAGATQREPQPPASPDWRVSAKRIALVCDWYLPRIGGIERHLARLADHLTAAGHSVTVITPMKGARSERPGVQIQHVPARLLPGAGLIWTPTAFGRIGTAIRSGGFDVVHVHGSIISPAAFAALYHAQRAGLPTISTTHSCLGGFTSTFRRLDRWCRWSRWPVLYSAVSERVARELRPILHPRRVLVLPNAVDPDGWHLPHRPPGDLIAMACVMRLVRRKRGAVLLRAVQRVCAELPPDRRVCLQIAGDGPERRRLEAQARSLGLGGTVRFLGALTPPEVKALLAASHYFVLPSILEAFGIAALEARAAGLPVVAMRESGVQEFIQHGRDGLLADNDGQLAEHLLRLATDDELRTRITEHNHRTAVTCTWDRILAAHLTAYQQAARTARAARSEQA
jgi:glycosyltransferase involved in cell wall biosynthesis